MNNFLKIMMICVSCMMATFSFAFNLRDGHYIFQLGGFQSLQGKTQFVGINTLIGNTYTVSQHDGYSPLFGFGYYLHGFDRKVLHFTYGLDAFYFPETKVRGIVIQEQRFYNLDYHYSISHVPLYAAAKATINRCHQYAITMDIGIGPNFMMAKKYDEHSHDGGITIPDNAFSDRTNTVFSAMAGIGIKMNHIFGQAPMECGYRFFYLGHGHFNKKTHQLLKSLETGQTYANALFCAVNV